jgi:hypothetical protein
VGTTDRNDGRRNSPSLFRLLFRRHFERPRRETNNNVRGAMAINSVEASHVANGIARPVLAYNRHVESKLTAVRQLPFETQRANRHLRVELVERADVHALVLSRARQVPIGPRSVAFAQQLHLASVVSYDQNALVLELRFNIIA